MSAGTVINRSLTINAMALSLCVASNVNVVLWGNPGQGKTSIIKSIAQSFGFNLETVIASSSEPTDFSGLPYFKKDGTTHRAEPSWARSVVSWADSKPDAKSIVFYDELSTAPPSVQAVILRPILEKVVGELQMPLATRSVAAANPPSIAANGWEPSPPNANRLTHLDWAMDAEYFKTGFLHGWPTIPALRFVGTAQEQKEMRAKAMSLVGIFVHRRPALLDTTPTGFDNMMSGSDTTFRSSQYAFTSPRSWEVAAKLYATFKLATLANGDPIPDAVLAVLLEGTIGVPATKEFTTFVRKLDLPDPHALLDGRVKFKMTNRPDLLEATLASLLPAFTHSPSGDKWNRWGDLLAEMTLAGKGDIAYNSMSAWSKHRPPGSMPSKHQTEALGSLLTELNP